MSSCHPLSVPTASLSLGGPWAHWVHVLPPRDPSRLPRRESPVPRSLGTRRVALSSPFHHFGGYPFHILRWKCLSPVPAATPLDFPTPVLRPLQMGPTCVAMHDGDRLACQECGGASWARWLVRGALRGPTGKATSSSRLATPTGGRPPRSGRFCHGCQMLRSGPGEAMTGGCGQRRAAWFPARAAEWSISGDLLWPK